MARYTLEDIMEHEHTHSHGEVHHEHHTGDAQMTLMPVIFNRATHEHVQVTENLPDLSSIFYNRGRALTVVQSEVGQEDHHSHSNDDLHSPVKAKKSFVREGILEPLDRVFFTLPTEVLEAREEYQGINEFKTYKLRDTEKLYKVRQKLEEIEQEYKRRIDEEIENEHAENDGHHCNHTHHHHHHSRKKENNQKINLKSPILARTVQIVLLTAYYVTTPLRCPWDDIEIAVWNSLNQIWHFVPISEKQEKSAGEDMVFPERIRFVVELKRDADDGEEKSKRSALDVLRERRRAREEEQEQEAQLLADARIEKQKNKKKRLSGFSKIAAVIGIGLSLFGAGDSAMQHAQSETSHTPNKTIVDTRTDDNNQTTDWDKTTKKQASTYELNRQYIVKDTDTGYDQILLKEHPEFSQQLVDALRNYEERQQQRDLDYISVGETITLPGQTTITIMQKALKRYASVKNSTDTNYLVQVSKAVYALGNPQEADNVPGGVIYDATLQNAASVINDYIQFIQANGITP